ncbi:YkyA family protein [Amphibacillus jilinensis]|uniref:YkyA family protein n=1 Tax=Amphibacillus jilinensis TaxID=1216008 RepID=UPI0002F5F5FC|nr:YkyA family protein [Amphibacillus jilinensis]
MRLKMVGLMILSGLLLVACSGQSTEETMYEHMEEAVRLEGDFVDQQQPLGELEQKEQDIYQEISELGMDEYEEIRSLAEQAIASIEERRELTEKEIASIEASKSEFEQVEPLIADLEDEALQETAQEMVEKMNERYQAFLALHEAYQSSLDYDIALYELLMKEDLEEPEFTEQVDQVNSQYQEVIDANHAFNDATDAFNERKREFYDQSDLNITYE